MVAAEVNELVDYNLVKPVEVKLLKMDEGFEIIGEISDIEIIAISRRIRDVRRLKRNYGDGRWRKLKGRATVRLPDGTVSMAEIHWYEMISAGRKELKIKRLVK